MITHNFLVTAHVVFKTGEDLALRYRDSEIAGLDVVHTDGTRTPLPGRMLTALPLDIRTKMPISVNGVQLWRGF